MKYKKILIVAVLLMAILTVGAVSASEDADIVAQDSDTIVSQDNAIDNDLGYANNPDGIEPWEYKNSRIGYYKGTIDDDYEGPIITVYAPRVNDFQLTIFETENYTYMQHIYLNDTVQYDNGIYTNDSVYGWTYYGITAEDVGYFENCADGDELNLYIVDMYRAYASTSDPIGAITFKVYHQGDNLILADEEPFSGPTAIIEVYGTETSAISYDDGSVFAIIVSRDSSSSQPVPAEELRDAVLSVTAVNPDGEEITLLSNTLDQFEYWDVGSNIEVLFTLSDVLNFTGVRDNAVIRFEISGSDVYKCEERSISFESDNILLNDVVEPEPEPAPEINLEVYGGPFNEQYGGNVVILDIEPDEEGNNPFPDSYLKVYIGDDGYVDLPLDEFNYTTIEGGIIRYGFTLEDLNNFEGVSSASFVKFILWLHEWDIIPFIEDKYLFYIGDEGFTLKHPPELWIRSYIDENNEYDVNHVAFVVMQYDGDDEPPIDEAFYNGTLVLFVDGNQREFSMRISELNESDEIRVYPDEDCEGYMCYGVTLNDTNILAYDEGTRLDFVFFDSYRNDILREIRIIRLDNEENVIELQEPDGDFIIVTYEANAADNASVLKIEEDQIKNTVNESGNLKDEFSIIVNLWGNVMETVWKVSELEFDDEGYCYWTTGDLRIDELLWDITDKVDIEIRVIFNLEDDSEQVAEQSTIVWKNPFIDSGEFALDTYNDGPIVFLDLLEDHNVNDEFNVIVKKEGVQIANNSFSLQNLTKYESEDEEDESEDRWYISLEELGITETGQYDVLMQFTTSEDELLEYSGSFTVVPFAIRIYSNGDNPWVDVMDPVFCIYLDEDATGGATVYVNGTKVFEKQFSDMIYDEYHRGGGYFIKLNDFNITEDGIYNVTLTADTDGASRTVEVILPVEVSDNIIYFRDMLYLDDYFVNVDDLHTPITSPIILYLNGTKAGEGWVSDGLRWNITSADYADEYGFLKPGIYQGKLTVDGEIISEDTFSVLDDSGNIEVDIKENYSADEPLTINFTSTSSSKGDIYQCDLFIYVDPVFNGRFFDENNMTELRGEELEYMWVDVLEVELPSLEPGIHTILIKYYPDVSNYDEADYLIKFYTINVIGGPAAEGTVLSAPDVTAVYGNGDELVATLKDVNGNVISGAEVKVGLKGIIRTLTTNAQGKASLSLNGITPGDYLADIIFEGDDYYRECSTTANVVINKADTNIDAPDVSVAYKNTTEIVATLTNAYGKPLSVNMNVNFNGESYTVKADSKGQITIPVGSLAPGSYTASISYAGNANYNPSSTTANVVVNKADTFIAAPDVSLVYKGGSGELVATLTNVYGNALAVNMNVNFNGASYTLKADKKGQIRMSLDNLATGNYTATISYNGNANYNPSSTTANVVVNRADTVIAVSNASVVYMDSDGKLVATLKNIYGNALGVNVNVNLNGETYTIKANSKGQVIIPTNDLPVGTHVATITYNGNVNYNPSSATANIVVKKADSTILPRNVSLAYKNPVDVFIATLKDVYGNPVSGNVNVNLNGKTYAAKADSRGIIKISTATLSPGSYAATITFAGNANYKSSSAIANIVITKADAVISAPDVSVAYKDTDGALVATITNAYGKALNVNLNVNLNNVNYTVKADSNGMISVSTAGLAPGSYVATISYNGNVNYKPVTATANVVVNKANTSISAPDVSVAYKDSTGQLVATLTNAYGKPLSVNVNVNLNGETYTVKADSKGQIIIPTAGLAPGNYTATITYNGNVNYNPSTVTANVVVNKADTIITAQDVTVNYGDENGKLTATLKNAYGNGLGVNVKVNLNGQTYTIKANSKGQINIPTKDLAVGSYVATITYNGNVNYNPTSTTATITVKK